MMAMDKDEEVRQIYLRDPVAVEDLFLETEIVMLDTMYIRHIEKTATSLIIAGAILFIAGLVM